MGRKTDRWFQYTALLRLTFFGVGWGRGRGGRRGLISQNNTLRELQVLSLQYYTSNTSVKLLSERRSASCFMSFTSLFAFSFSLTGAFHCNHNSSKVNTPTLCVVSRKKCHACLICLSLVIVQCFMTVRVCNLFQWLKSFQIFCTPSWKQEIKEFFFTLSSPRLM